MIAFWGIERKKQTGVCGRNPSLHECIVSPKYPNYLFIMTMVQTPKVTKLLFLLLKWSKPKQRPKVRNGPQEVRSRLRANWLRVCDPQPLTPRLSNAPSIQSWNNEFRIVSSQSWRALKSHVVVVVRRGFQGLVYITNDTPNEKVQHKVT